MKNNLLKGETNGVVDGRTREGRQLMNRKKLNKDVIIKTHFR